MSAMAWVKTSKQADAVISPLLAAKILNGMSKRSYLGTSSAAFVIGHIGYLPM